MKNLLIGAVLSVLSIAAIAAPQTPQETAFLKKFNAAYPKLGVNDAIYLPNVQLYELHKKGDIRLMYTNESMNFIMTNNEVYLFISSVLF